MLIDSFVPDPDAAEIHSIQIAASKEDVCHALRTTDFAHSVVIKGLLALRALPRFLRHPGRSGFRLQRLTLDSLARGGFGLLAEDPGREIVFGVAGRFWQPVDNTVPFDERHFRGAVDPGLARGVWNFSVRDDGAGRTTLSTETRVLCGDRASRRKFRTYWLLVRPFSGLIRIVMLRAVRSTALRRRV
jgi:hypothetical protein